MRFVYLVSAFLGFASAVHFGLPFFLEHGLNLPTAVRLAGANAVASTLSSDLLIVYVASCIWMVVDGRRRRMQHVWAYLFGSTFVAVAFGLGLFMFVRHRHLVSERATDPG
jgi:hypothetical protein